MSVAGSNTVNQASKDLRKPTFLMGTGKKINNLEKAGKYLIERRKYDRG